MKPGPKLGLVGYGSIAEEHLTALQGLDAEVAWLVGRNPEETAAFAQRYGIPRWTLDLDEALTWDAEGVILTTPSDLHAAQAEACLRARKHPLVEIPLATRLVDAERVAAVAAGTVTPPELGAGGPFRIQVAHTQRYFPALMELRRRIEAGELTPHHLVCRWFFLRRENVNWKGRRRSWTDNLLWHHACHVVDAALWLLGGEGEGVRAQFGPAHPELGIPLDLDLQFRVGRTLVTVAMSYNSPSPRHDYCLLGEEATLEFRDNGLWDGDRLIHEAPEGWNPIREQNREWLTAIREGREAAVNCAAVMPAMRVLQAAQEQLDAR